MKRLFTPQWQDPEQVEVPDELRQSITGSDLLLETLVQRGYSDPEKARAFLDPEYYLPASPLELPDLAKAVQRIQSAVAAHEKVGVWGDFDVDGQTSTTVLVSGLRHLGADVVYHIPIRDTESHGMLLQPLKAFLSQGVQLIITCDTGITAHESIDYANTQGVDVIITDHHSLPPELPSALVVINPQRLPESHPLQTLSGVGVAYKLIEQLCLEANDLVYPPTLLDLVALGLIADMAILKQDARYLVQKGLEILQSNPRPSLKKILSENKVTPQQVTEETVSFVIAPRMNAVGRLDDANPMVEFLLSDDPTFLATEYNQIEGLNANRKIRCDEVFKGAQAVLEANPRLLDRPLIFLAHPDWHGGVVGIVASRLVELYHRPVILLNSSDPAAVRGSCRSVEGINITEALRQNSQFLLGFGGHPMAAGLSVRSEDLDILQFGLISSINQMIADKHIVSKLSIDAYIDLKSIDLDLLLDLSQLAPFGPGNSPLRFAAKDLSIESFTSLGKVKDHLQMNLQSAEGDNYRFIWWQGAGLPQPEGRFDLLFHARASDYKGKVEVMFEWEDFRETQEQISATRINNNKNNLIQFDYRSSRDPISKLTQLAAEPGAQIWCEGSTPCPLSSFPREKLTPNNRLIIWFIPPHPQVIQQVIAKVKPSQLFWFANLPLENDLAILLKKTVSFVKKYLLDRPDQPFFYLSLAQQLAVTSSMAKVLVNWMASSGEITLLRMEAEIAVIKAQKHSPDLVQLAKCQKEIQTIHKEITAFRDFYMNAVSIEALAFPQKEK
jgi:single-stranded-DNA-specific exonuclease